MIRAARPIFTNRFIFKPYSALDAGTFARVKEPCDYNRDHGEPNKIVERRCDILVGGI